MADKFHIIDDVQCVLRVNGKRFKQAKLYRKGDRIYAGIGSDYVRLDQGAGTSDPNVSWQDMDSDPRIAGGVGSKPRYVE